MNTRNLHATPPEPGSFSEVFLQRLDRLEADMDSVGMSMSTVCREADVSRSTPDRWRKVIPKTVESLSTMEAVVARRVREAREQGKLPATQG